MVRPVEIHLFASARHIVGQRTVRWSVPEGGVAARELIAGLRHRFPRLGPTLRVSRFLRNDRYVTDLDETVRPGDAFAVHPPYGGG
jgi:molybdopterin converting factor small subunit